MGKHRSWEDYLEYFEEKKVSKEEIEWTLEENRKRGKRNYDQKTSKELVTELLAASKRGDIINDRIRRGRPIEVIFKQRWKAYELSDGRDWDRRVGFTMGEFKDVGHLMGWGRLNHNMTFNPLTKKYE